ncbi:hypothetical protein AVEN_205815-1 [Araneus ventricosus]|uniref:DDE-1 domain-containing protein n=1 Tax=Araneus ventricosus TaxID=182803 RepID=A0A4Y2LYB5_ARAVE|nr:hypothetical protein AVEN_205815-1 [Araneus ventricosus]
MKLSLKSGKFGSLYSNSLVLKIRYKHLKMHKRQKSSLAVIIATVGKRKAFSIGARKTWSECFSQNEIEHFECYDDDVITSGEVSEEDIVTLVNEKNNSIVDSSSNMEEGQDEPWPSIADAKTF